MRKHYSLVHADKVLAKVKKILGRDFGGDRVEISCWANGREQGYCIKTFPTGNLEPMALVMAQQRSSDSFLVVSGRSREFDNHNQPCERIWRNAGREFEDDEEAARHIADFIFKAIHPVVAAIAGGVPGETE